MLTTLETFTAKDQSTVILRPARQEDAQEIINSVANIIKEGTYIQKEKARSLQEERAFIHDMSEKNNMYIVIEVNGIVRGIARVIRGELKMKQHTGIFRTWLHQEAQGKGIGKKIMEFTIDWCKRQNLHKLCLTVFESNEAAKGLYESVGFVVEGVQKDQAFLNHTYQNEIFMAYFFRE